jgi:hypothetical protein
VDGEGEGDCTATGVKIPRDGFEEDAEGVDSDGGLAKEKAHGSDRDDPPAVEKAHAS